MTTEPTEARQDELAGEKIAQILRNEVSIDVQTVTDSINKWETYTGQIQEGFVAKISRRLLSLVVSSGGGKCPVCKGNRTILNIWDNTQDCITCNGTGQKQPKTLGEIIKEWEDGKRS